MHIVENGRMLQRREFFVKCERNVNGEHVHICVYKGDKKRFVAKLIPRDLVFELLPILYFIDRFRVHFSRTVAGNLELVKTRSQ